MEHRIKTCFLTGFVFICITAYTPGRSSNNDAINGEHIPSTPIAGNTETIYAQCSAMQPPAAKTITVNDKQADQLQSIIANAKQGDTILLEDGYYDLEGANLWISTPGVSLRSASGNPENVILDGSYKSTEIITVAASNVTIGELTLTRAFTHAIHVVSSNFGNTDNTLIYRVKITDSREQAIKINPHKAGFYADHGIIACSTILLTDSGRPNVNPVSGGCYTGGIDAHQAKGWVVRGNKINGFWCPVGLAEHAIHFWRGSRDTLVEGNRLTNNARGIGLGLTDSGSARTFADDVCPLSAGSYIGHYGGIVKNNMIFASSSGLFESRDGFDCGICLSSSCNTKVVHNSIVSLGSLFSSIEMRFSGTTGSVVYNNITSHPVRERNGGSGILHSNLINVEITIFKNGAKGDLHLSPDAISAIDQGTVLKPGICDEDFDDDLRDFAPDIGADEISTSTGSHKLDLNFYH